MSDVTTVANPSTGTADVATPPELGRLIRSLIHRQEADGATLPVEGHLPGFEGATGWLNSEPLTPAGLRGRVVLVDFWTYTCINWLRTLPYVRAWATKYHDLGLTVIGVHTPEFGFEHERDNVIAAARDENVDYPIALDNDYAVWRAFANNYWPAIYIADAEGRLRYHHFGEGEYAMTEMVIQQLLTDAGAEGIDGALVQVKPDGFEVDADWQNVRSPETYLGYGRTTGFASPDDLRSDEAHTYPEPSGLRLNRWAPIGNWTIARHAAVLNDPNGRIAFRFHARDVHLVMGPATRGTSVPMRVTVDGQTPGASHGLDVDESGDGTVADQRLYQLIRQNGPISERVVEIEFLEPGIEVYCFTFG
jgi:thiol-disulfide isomerase/thioredoxin